MKLTKLLVVVFALLFAVLSVAEPQVATFQDPNERGTVDHYTIYWGTVQGGPYNVGSAVLNCPTPLPPSGDITCAPVEVAPVIGVRTYYAVLTAAAIGSGEESGYSNEASFTIEPSQLLPLIQFTIVPAD